MPHAWHHEKPGILLQFCVTASAVGELSVEPDGPVRRCLVVTETMIENDLPSRLQDMLQPGGIAGIARARAPARQAFVLIGKNAVTFPPVGGDVIGGITLDQVAYPGNFRRNAADPGAAPSPCVVTRPSTEQYSGSGACAGTLVAVVMDRFAMPNPLRAATMHPFCAAMAGWACARSWQRHHAHGNPCGCCASNCAAAGSPAGRQRNVASKAVG